VTFTSLKDYTLNEARVISDASSNVDQETVEWMMLQEESFAKAWDNDEDGAYDAV